MKQTDRADSQRKFIPSLEGVRGYAFLIVFLAHFLNIVEYNPQKWWSYPEFLFGQIDPLVLPVFFVLSGYLICGILIDTREREGYFKVFYARRTLRVFPLYYLTLLGSALISKMRGYPLTFPFWIHFLYIHNLFPIIASNLNSFPTKVISHLWSMGVEEQFYMLWPLVVWLCPNRRILLRVTLLLIAFSVALRFAFPLLKLPPRFIYFWTPTRVDAILLGGVLVMIRGEKIYRWLEPIAQYIALGGLVTIALISSVKQSTVLGTPVHAATLISLWNIIAAGIVVAAMRKGSFLCRACSMKGICWLGARSYGLYLFHLIILLWFLHSCAPRLAGFMPSKCAFLVAAAGAFGLTVLLAALCYRFIEEPAMNLKKVIKYGGVKKPPALQQPADSTLVDAG
jgi:peptidoglycan/LPS O-acetylase OafA/YrhL